MINGSWRDQVIVRDLFSLTVTMEPILRLPVVGCVIIQTVKDSSISQHNFGWDVQVIQKPFDGKSSSNLLYHSLEWHGPYPSQVDAWHVTEKYFQNERELDVRGYPYRLKIVLVNPVVEGTGSDTRFVSGRVKVSWRRKP